MNFYVFIHVNSTFLKMPIRNQEEDKGGKKRTQRGDRFLPQNVVYIRVRIRFKGGLQVIPADSAKGPWPDCRKCQHSRYAAVHYHRARILTHARTYVWYACECVGAAASPRRLLKWPSWIHFQTIREKERRGRGEREEKERHTSAPCGTVAACGNTRKPITQPAPRSLRVLLVTRDSV